MGRVAIWLGRGLSLVTRRLARTPRGRHFLAVVGVEASQPVTQYRSRWALVPVAVMGFLVLSVPLMAAGIGLQPVRATARVVGIDFPAPEPERVYVDRIVGSRESVVEDVVPRPIPPGAEATAQKRTPEEASVSVAAPVVAEPAPSPKPRVIVKRTPKAPRVPDVRPQLRAASKQIAALEKKVAKQNEKIQKVQDRIAKAVGRARERMEAQLAELQAQAAALASQLAGLLGQQTEQTAEPTPTPTD